MRRIEALPEGQPRCNYDALLTALGYETRSTHAASRVAASAGARLAIVFGRRQVGAFKKNLAWFGQNQFTQLCEDPGTLEERIDQALGWREKPPAGQADALTVAVDISCMSRPMIASTIAWLLRSQRASPVIADFLYSPAAWTEPSLGPEPIASAGAVSAFFAGWSTDLDLPPAAIIGLGYEPDKAVGAFEYLEATRAWVFLPFGTDPRYDASLKRANAALLSKLDPRNVIKYRVLEPIECVTMLEEVTLGALATSRPVLVPFGPKIFALSALLVSALHRETPVWRFSSEQLGEPIDREPTGAIVGLRVTIEPGVPSAANGKPPLD